MTTVDPQVLNERITGLVSQLGAVRPDACCAGAAGVEVPEARARLDALLRRLLPGSRVCVVHDSRLVLAAAGLDSGIALIAGTGSVAYGRAPDGREVQRGGWGWMIGDEGSGVWVTREAARLILARGESGESLGDLGEALLAAVGASDPRGLMGELLERHEARQWASLAPTVFETADRDAGSNAIIRRAAAELVRLVDQVGIAGMVVLAGGLLLNQPLLEIAVRQQIGRDCIRLEEPPVEGAVRLAEDMLTA